MLFKLSQTHLLYIFSLCVHLVLATDPPLLRISLSWVDWLPEVETGNGNSWHFNDSGEIFGEGMYAK